MVLCEPCDRLAKEMMLCLFCNNNVRMNSLNLNLCVWLNRTFELEVVLCDNNIMAEPVNVRAEQ